MRREADVTSGSSADDELLWELECGTRCIVRRVEPDGCELLALALDGSIVRHEPMRTLTSAITVAEAWRQQFVRFD